MFEAAKTSKKLIDQSMDIMSHLDSEISFQTKVVEDMNKGHKFLRRNEIMIEIKV